MSRYGKGESYIKRQLMPYLREHNLIVQDNKKLYSIADLDQHINGYSKEIINTLNTNK